MVDRLEEEVCNRGFERLGLRDAPVILFEGRLPSALGPTVWHHSQWQVLTTLSGSLFERSPKFVPLSSSLGG